MVPAHPKKGKEKAAYGTIKNQRIRSWKKKKIRKTTNTTSLQKKRETAPRGGTKRPGNHEKRLLDRFPEKKERQPRNFKTTGLLELDGLLNQNY